MTSRRQRSLLELPGGGTRDEALPVFLEGIFWGFFVGIKQRKILATWASGRILRLVRSIVRRSYLGFGKPRLSSRLSSVAEVRTFWLVSGSFGTPIVVFWG
jgi:hypothetical protein